MMLVVFLLVLGSSWLCGWERDMGGDRVTVSVEIEF